MAHRIRRMQTGDKTALLNILDIIPEFSPADVLVAKDVIDSYLRDPVTSGYIILVAEIEKNIIGYICYGLTPLTQGTWDIYWIATSSGNQKKGIGGALMKKAESQIIKFGGRLIMIETSSRQDYENTRRFYHHHGYEIVCRIPDFYAPGEDKIILQKRPGE